MMGKSSQIPYSNKVSGVSSYTKCNSFVQEVRPVIKLCCSSPNMTQILFDVPSSFSILRNLGWLGKKTSCGLRCCNQETINWLLSHG